MTELDEIKCANCGAALGAASASGEYHCPFCAHVSRAAPIDRLRPVHGARDDEIVGRPVSPSMLAYLQRETDAQLARAAERAEVTGRAAREAREERAARQVTEKRQGALFLTIFSAAFTLGSAGVAVHAHGSGDSLAALGGGIGVLVFGALAMAGVSGLRARARRDDA